MGFCAAYNKLPRTQEAKTTCSKSSFESSPRGVYKNITALTQSLEKGRSWRKSYKNGWMMLLDLLVLCRSEEEFSEHNAEDEDDEGGVDVGSGQHLVLGTDRHDCCRTVAGGVMGLLASRSDPFQPQSFLLQDNVLLPKLTQLLVQLFDLTHSCIHLPRLLNLYWCRLTNLRRN